MIPILGSPVRSRIPAVLVLTTQRGSTEIASIPLKKLCAWTGLLGFEIGDELANAYSAGCWELAK